MKVERNQCSVNLETVRIIWLFERVWILKEKNHFSKLKESKAQNQEHLLDIVELCYI